MKTFFTAIPVAISLAIPGLAAAQTQDVATDDSAEIIVTAQRRNQSLKDVPISVSVISSAQIANNRIADTSGLVALAPGVSGKAQGIATPVFAIRGISTNSIGIGGESSVGVFWDEAYLGRLESANLPLFDVERIEVLKGPQSTLFGRNASAGVISITSRRPGNILAGNAAVSYGSFNRAELSGGIDIPLITDKLAIRSAALYRRSDGTERNVLLGTNAAGGDTLAVRTIIAAKPAEGLKLTLIGNYVRDNGTGFPSETSNPALTALAGLPVDAFDGLHAQDAATFERRRTFTGALIAEYDVSDTLKLKSITTLLHTTLDRQFDADGSPLPLLAARFRDYENDNFGQELRLTGRSNTLDWSLGGSYFDERVGQIADLTYSEFALLGNTAIARDTFFSGQPPFTLCSEPLTTDIFGVACNSAAVESISARGRNRSYAIFGDVSYKLTPHLTATVGGRWSLDRKRFDYFVPPVAGVSALVSGGNSFTGATNGTRFFNNSSSSFQPKFALNYALTTDTNLFGSISRGFKPGGFDPTPVASDVSFNPESVWAYEIGARHSSSDRKLRLNASLYLQNYRGYQLQILRNGTTSTINAPRVRSYGAEVEASFQPLSGWKIEANAALNNSSFRNLVVGNTNLTGNRLLYAPRFTGFIATDVEIVKSSSFGVSARASLRHESRQFFTRENRPEESSASFDVVDAFVAVSFDQPAVAIKAYARNLFNKKYLIYAVDQGFGVVTNRGEPRSFGIEASASF